MLDFSKLHKTFQEEMQKCVIVATEGSLIKLNKVGLKNKMNNWSTLLMNMVKIGNRLQNFSKVKLDLF